MGSSQWNTILTAAELDRHYKLLALVDSYFAAEQRAFYESRTVEQLRAHAQEAWNCCSPTGYQLARSHAALLSTGGK